MNLGLFAQAPLLVKIHLAVVIPAFFLGGWLIVFSTKGARFHRLFGTIYLVLMTMTAIVTFFIRGTGHLSWLHLFIPLTLFGVIASVINLRRGNIPGHKRAMIMLYVGALVIAGVFAFAPGRLMHDMVLGPTVAS